MANGYTQVAPDSTGDKIDTSELTVGANTVSRQRIVLADDATAGGLAAVTNSAPTTEYGLVTRNIPSGTQNVADGGGSLSVDDGGGSVTVDSAQLPSALVSGRLDVAVGAALPAGNNNIGDVDIASIAAGDNTVGRVKLTDGTNVATVNSNGALQVTGGVAHDATDSGNPLKVGGQARTTNPTAVADADRVNATFDDLGRQVVILNNVRDLVVQQTTTISTTGETTILTQAASTFHDLTMLMITNTSATAVRVDIRDTTGGSVVFSVAIAANGGAVIPFAVPFKQTTVNTNWTAQLSGAVTDIRILVQAVKNV